MRPRLRLRTLVLLTLVSLLATPLAASESQTVRVRVGDLVLEAPASLESELARLAEAARRIVPELERDLDVRARGPYRIVLLPNAPRLDGELERIDQLAPPWAAGFLAGPLRTGGIRLGQVRRYPHDGVEEVLAHEIAHMLLYDASRDPLPAWFSEGVATFEGRRRGIRDFVETARAVLVREPPTLEQLDAAFEQGPGRVERAYAASLDFVASNVRWHGSDFVPRVVEQLDERSLEEAWRREAGETIAVSERRWRRTSVWLHRWLPLLGSTSTLWLGITLLAVLAGLARRRRDRLILAGWDAEEAPAQAEAKASATLRANTGDEP